MALLGRRSGGRAAASLLAVAIAVSGCASGGMPRVEQERTGISVVVGCVGGATIGALVAIATGKNPAAYAAGGCVGGAVAGLALSAYVNAKTRSYASEHERLQALTEAATADAAALESHVADVTRHIAEEKQAIVRLERDVAAGRASAQALAQKRDALKSQAEQLGDDLGKIDAHIQEIDNDRRELAAQGLDVEGLEAPRERLAAARARLTTVQGDLSRSVS